MRCIGKLSRFRPCIPVPLALSFRASGGVCDVYVGFLFYSDALRAGFLLGSGALGRVSAFSAGRQVNVAFWRVFLSGVLRQPNAWPSFAGCSFLSLRGLRWMQARSPLGALRHFRIAPVPIFEAEVIGEVQKRNKLPTRRLGNLDANPPEFVIKNAKSEASFGVSVVYKEIHCRVEAATWHSRRSPIHLPRNFGAKATG